MRRSWAGMMQRRRATVNPRPRVLIVCEGEKTEYRYFEGLRSKENNRLVKVKVAYDHPDPETVVKCAIQKKAEAEQTARQLRDENEMFDEVWCVVDVDTHDGLDRAIAVALKNGIKMAISNPCFELWILLHASDFRAQAHSKAMKSACKKAIPNFDGTFDFDRYWNAYTTAVERARKLDKNRRTAIPLNPATRVYVLTERLKQLGKSQALKTQIRTVARARRDS